MKRIGSFLPQLIQPVFKKGNALQAKIFLDWQYIVGEPYSAICWPDKIQFPQSKKDNAVLYVMTYSGGSALQMSYVERMMLDKINTYFGFKAIHKIVFLQQLPAEHPSNQSIETINLPSMAVVDPICLGTVEDLKLRACLRSFYQALMSKNR